MDQDTQNSQISQTPQGGMSGYKIAALILGVVAVLVVAGAILIPRFTKPRQSDNTPTAPEILSVSAIPSKTQTKNPNTSATGTASATTDTSGRSQEDTNQITPTPESNSGGASGTASCSAYDFNLDESQCLSLTPEKVCGIIRYVYDNSEEATRSSTFTNVCEYCAQFDESGFLELRGAKMYSKGYSMGSCP